MKTHAAIILSLLTIFSTFAQVQKGVVRTIERPGRGVKYVDGTTIRAQGLFNAAVSDADGAFALDFGSTDIREGEAFRLSRVNKSGYELSDKGAIGKEYPLSVSVPLEIVLINIAEREADKQRIADKAYARADKTYKAKLADLERQLSDKSIDAETYRTQLRDLQDKFDKYEKLIDAMAERYASTDYAHIDSLNARVNIAIENGDLELADSLIRTVGSLEALVSQNMEAMRRADAQEEIGRAIVANAKQDKDSIAADRQRLGDLLYNKAQLHLAAFENDSTTHYYRLRAELDSTNVEWQLDAGLFISNCLADYKTAMRYCQRALEQSYLQYGENSARTAICNNNIGALYDILGCYDMALDYYNKALATLCNFFGEHPYVAVSYNYIGSLHNSRGDYTKALEYHRKALSILQEAFGERHFHTAATYNNLGSVYSHRGDYDKALEYYGKALVIQREILGEKNGEIAGTYLNLGTTYSHQGCYVKALEYFNKALNIQREIVGMEHPSIATLYNNMGSGYNGQGDYEKALKYHYKALNINQKSLGIERHPIIATSYNNIGFAYHNQGNYDMALKYYMKSLDILLETLEKNHPNIATIYYSIAITHTVLKDYHKALEYYEKALIIIESQFTQNGNGIAAIKDSIEDVKQKITETD